MRNAIREHLLEKLPGLFNDIYEPHMPTGETPKPYAVIRQGGDVKDEDWMGFTRPIEIWPYVSRSTFTIVDDMCDQIIKALDRQVITDLETGEVFTCNFDGSTQDQIDNDFDLITRGLQFSVLALKPIDDPPEIYAPDPWVDALSAWTQNLLSDWKVYRGNLPIGYERPSVLWRLKTVRSRPVSRGLAELQKVIVGHVFGTTINQQTLGIVTLVHEIENAIKIPLDPVERTFLTVDGQPMGDTEADPESAPQITVTLRRKLARTLPTYPIMMEADGRRVEEGGES